MFDYPGALRQPTVFTMTDAWRACIWVAERRGSRLIVGEAANAKEAIAMAVQKADALRVSI